VRLDAIAAIVLASGLSRRFGRDDKLLAPLRGRPLGAHCAASVAQAEFLTRIAVVPKGVPERRALFDAGKFRIAENVDPGAGMGASLAQGARMAQDSSAEGAMILLADMPFVGAADYAALGESLGPAAAAVSVVGGVRTPPVLFARSLFDALARLSGDMGAKDVLRAIAPVVEVDLPAERAIDIDSRADLQAWESERDG
jgi:molybdenum cofactor cytidylyltransferase